MQGRDEYVALAAAVILSGTVTMTHDEKEARAMAIRHARALADEFIPEEPAPPAQEPDPVIEVTEAPAEPSSTPSA